MCSRNTLFYINNPFSIFILLESIFLILIFYVFFFNPFSIDAVFAYHCKLEMQYRWARLDVETGKETFRQIIENLRSQARVPEEFIQK